MRWDLHWLSFLELLRVCLHAPNKIITTEYQSFPTINYCVHLIKTFFESNFCFEFSQKTQIIRLDVNASDPQIYIYIYYYYFFHIEMQYENMVIYFFQFQRRSLTHSIRVCFRTDLAHFENSSLFTSIHALQNTIAEVKSSSPYQIT